MLLLIICAAYFSQSHFFLWSNRFDKPHANKMIRPCSNVDADTIHFILRIVLELLLWLFFLENQINHENHLRTILSGGYSWFECVSNDKPRVLGFGNIVNHLKLVFYKKKFIQFLFSINFWRLIEPSSISYFYTHTDTPRSCQWKLHKPFQLFTINSRAK